MNFRPDGGLGSPVIYFPLVSRIPTAAYKVDKEEKAGLHVRTPVAQALRNMQMRFKGC